ncbi:restriction endonuclease subunit S [Tenacibaculum larymnensis]|uniref:Restriction endonuclease subunit S n=1 Tax=Tenacibaculum larymnensis TaxID=2878201 RepID=A0A9X4ILZ2_9FLAO|nr:restriction endonuclease subunit S [Tenacibaculum larymnensis]MDE1207098.1 restriction endonuclease subunit S [Tenacibaculum larymnensis]
MAAQEVVAERAGYKKTKLGWIPKEWNVDRIGKYIDIRSGESPSKFEEFDGGISYIKVDDLNNSLKYQLEGKFQVKKSKNIIPKGSIIFPKRGAAILNNKVRITRSDLFMDSNLMSITINLDLLDIEYLFYYILKRKLYKIADTSTIPQINNKHIIPLKIFIPPIQEQKAIANCLATWDTAIEKQTQLIQAKQTQKKALMQQLLTGKKRLPGFTEEWKEKSLTYFLDYTPRPITKPDIPFTKLGIRSHCKGTFQNKNFKPEDIAIDKLFRVKKNDLIVNITFAWEGAIAIVKQEDDEGLVSHRFPTYTFKKDIGNSLFFEQFIKTKRFRFLLELISPGGAGRNRVMSKKDFLKLKITIPKYKEQTAIANILNTADKEIELLQKQLTQLQEQKKGVMQQLLTGKKRLKF